MSRIICGDALTELRSLPDGAAACCVTSPPYWGLRDYGAAGQLGLEPTPEENVETMVALFREVRRVLRDDGTLWLNLGDSYNAYNGNAGPSSGFSSGAAADTQRPKLESGHGLRTKGLKPKDLVGIPWRVAFALQADGWYLRSDIIWHKPNPMPESVTDRPTKSHEYIFLLSKSEKYHYDNEAILEECQGKDERKWAASYDDAGSILHEQSHAGVKRTKRYRSGNKERKTGAERGCPDGTGSNVCGSVPWEDDGAGRNKRTVWTVTTKPFKGAHFAVFPPDLIKPCILAGCPKGGTVLDPFFGSGTTGIVANDCGCDYIGIELNPEYVKMAEKRLRQKVLDL